MFAYHVYDIFLFNIYYHSIIFLFYIYYHFYRRLVLKYYMLASYIVRCTRSTLKLKHPADGVGLGGRFPAQSL